MKMLRIKSLCALGLCLGGLYAQEAPDPRAAQQSDKALRASTEMTWEANKQLSQNEFIPSEGNYRKAISKSGQNMAAPFNLGNAYYNRESFGEAFGSYKQAGEAADEKPEKHKAFHNMGNVFMRSKEYQKAVEAYKEALRNDPTDDETRYNLALAKKMQEKQQEEQKNDQNKEQEDQKEDQKEQDKDKDQEQDKEGGDQEQKDQGDQGQDTPKEDQDGEGDNKQQPDQKPGQGDKPEEKQPQPRPNELSKQQIQNLLEAMQNEERKVQEKMDAKKVRGKKIKNEKDW